MTEAKFVEQLQSIEAERLGDAAVSVAEAAVRVRGRLAEMRATEADEEFAVSVPNEALRTVFVTLCRRYRIDVFRASKRRDARLMIRVPPTFVKTVFMPIFDALAEATESHLADVAEHALRAAFPPDRPGDAGVG